MTLETLNHYYSDQNRPFNPEKEKDIKDFNFEVDALEDEHI
jgi:hypothetical protein